MYHYYVERGVRTFPHFEAESDHPTSFADILSMLFDKAERSPVFCKDMAYYVMPEIMSHERAANRMSHLFLIREPRRSIMSYYKLDPELLLEEVGYEAQWRLYQWLHKVTGAAPLVLRAEDVQANPEAALGAAWEHAGLSFTPQAFEWDSGDTPKEWKAVRGWHQKALNQSSIQLDTRTEREIDEAFSNLAAEAPRLEACLRHHLPYYSRLVECAWSS